MEIKLKRYDNWPTRLHNYIVANSKESFRFGWHDCGLFLCGAIKVMTGVDPAGDYRGQYGDEASAFEVIKEKYADLKELAEDIASKHNMEEVNKFFGQRGDAALLNTPAGWTLGVIALDGKTIIVPAKKGYERYDLKEAEKIWRVG